MEPVTNVCLASLVCSDLVFCLFDLSAFLSVHVVFGTSPGTLFQDRRNTNTVLFGCSVWLRDGYFLSYFHVSFHISPLNFFLTFSPNCCIQGKKQTFVRDISGGKFSVHMQGLPVSCTCLTLQFLMYFLWWSMCYFTKQSHVLLLISWLWQVL